MTDTPKPESGAEQASAELPIPKLESVSPGSPTSSVDTKALAKEVAAILKPDFERVAQSTKDKRIAALEKRLGTSDLAELEEQGVQIPDNVKLEYRLRNLEQERQTPESSVQASTSQGSGATLTAQEVQEAVKKFQLDANNAEVIGALRGTYRNRDHFENTLAQLALARANQPTPSASAATTIVGSGSQPEDGGASLVKGYETELAAIPRGNTIAVSNLKAKYRKMARDKGLLFNI